MWPVHTCVWPSNAEVRRRHYRQEGEVNSPVLIADPLEKARPTLPGKLEGHGNTGSF